MPMQFVSIVIDVHYLLGIFFRLSSYNLDNLTNFIGCLSVKVWNLIYMAYYEMYIPETSAYNHSVGNDNLISASYYDLSVSPEERAACRSAIIVALRLAANNSIQAGWWSQNKSHFAEIIHLVLDRSVSVNNSISEYTTLRWHHVHPILACLLCDISSSDHSTCVHTILQAVLSLIELICENDFFRKEFFSPFYIPGFGKLISTCLDVIADINRTSNVRILAFSILFTILKSTGSDVCSLSVLFPGLASKLVSVATGSINENLGIVEQCLKAFSLAVVICLKDSIVKSETINDSFPLDKDSSRQLLSPAIKELLVNRDKPWLEETSSRVKKLVSSQLISLTSNLSVHRAHSIRLCLIHSVNEIYSECSEAFNGSLDDLMLDLILILEVDEYESISQLTSDIIVRFRTEKRSVFSIHMHDKLKELSDMIPLKVRNGNTNCKTMFDQLSNVLHCLNSDLEHLAMSRSSSLQSLLQALAVIIRVDAQRLMISRNENNRRVIDLLLSLPLQSTSNGRNNGDLSRTPTLDTVFAITLSSALGIAISKLDKDTPKLKLMFLFGNI
uniref:HEAT repeat-containing protein 1 n=1 Tax=Heterorhabditis bacteriophora TaxID=37862 RepID=A0A1I7WXR5_HETBA